MKKLILCLMFVLLLSSCGTLEETRDPNLVRRDDDDDYAQGYDDGYEAAQEYEEFEKYKEYENVVNAVLEDAIDFACENGSWHPEEAALIIETYRDGGSVYTEKDYNTAVDSLIEFYQYFYDEKYEDYLRYR